MNSYLLISLILTGAFLLSGDIRALPFVIILIVSLTIKWFRT